MDVSAALYSFHQGGVAMPQDQYSILVVDDVRLDREILRKLLRKMGYYVRCVEDGLTALDILKTESFDLVLF